MASSSSPSNGSSPGAGAGGGSSSSPSNDAGNSPTPSNGSATPPPPPPPPAEPVILDSIADLVARLNLEVGGDLGPPEDFFDVQDLPPCLRDANEHQLRAVVADPNFPADITFWVKASSAAAFLQALAATPNAGGLPLHLYVMPSTPLRDARHFLEMAQGAEALPVEVAITVVNPIDLNNKVKAFNCTNSLLGDIEATRQALEKKLLDLAAFAAPKLQHAVEMQAQYDNAKALYQALPLPQKKPACEEHLSMLTAGGRHLLAREVAGVLQGARVSMEALADKLATSAAELQEALSQPTFMGTSPPAPGYDHY